jgi:hypothetical protein
MSSLKKTIGEGWSLLTTKHRIISAVLTIVVIGSSAGLTQSLILKNVNVRSDSVGTSAFTNLSTTDLVAINSISRQLNLTALFQMVLGADFLDVDTVVRTVTIDWYINAFVCAPVETQRAASVVNIFADL